MDNKNLMPQQAQPVNRTTTGQLPDLLAELSEEALAGDDSTSVIASSQEAWRGAFQMGIIPSIIIQHTRGCFSCSYNGDDAE